MQATQQRGDAAGAESRVPASLHARPEGEAVGENLEAEFLNSVPADS